MKRLALAVALLIALATPSQADYRDGLRAYSRGDYATALHELKPLAEQGHSDARLILGFMYLRGRGVPQNHAEAAKWFRKAAEQGEPMAQLGLGRMYALGRGVPQDYVQAHMWIDLAASRFAPGSERDFAIKLREAFAASMTPAQIAEAQRLAREWKPKRE